MLWDAEQSDRHPSRSLETYIARQSLCPGEPSMGTLCAGKGCGLDGRVRRSGRPDLDLDALITQELDTGTSVDPTTPVTPQQWRLPHNQWMQQDTDLTWLLGDLALPLALLAQRAGTTTANASAIHDAQAAISLSALLMRKQFLVCRTPQRPIGLESKVLPREAASFPEQAHLRGSIARGGGCVR
jgi:hypothetical protein